MTDRELRKLKRQDLLQMLVAQSKEAARLQAELDEKNEEAGRLLESQERLKQKLDEKDELIEKLKVRLDEKDAAIEEERAQHAELTERLKGKLNEKDALIEKLKVRLNHKDEKICRMEEELGSLRSGKWRELEDKGIIADLMSKLKTMNQEERDTDGYKERRGK